MSDSDEKQEFQIEGATPEMLRGGYANSAMVNHSPFEFTLDFIRRDFTRGGNVGPLVARINMSPLFVTQLIDMLQNNWDSYAEKALPPEAREQRPEEDA
jgi:hypothetical protein